MSIDSIREKIFHLAYSDDVPESLRFQLLSFLTRKEMDFMDLDDFPNMRAYIQRFKNLFTQYEMYDGYLSEKEKCEIILASLPDGYLTLGDAAANNPVNHEHIPTLVDELLMVEKAKEVKEAVRAKSKNRLPIRKVYERKNKKLKMDEGSSMKDNDNSPSSSQISADLSSGSDSSL